MFLAATRASLKSRVAVWLYRGLASILRDRGNAGLAETCLRQAARLDPSDPRSAFDLGKIYLWRGQPEQAEKAFRDALQARPEYAEARNNLGVALEQRGRLEEAEACYREALGLDPGSAAGHTNLGNIHLHRNRLDQAETCYRRALEEDRNYPEAYCNLGVVLRLRGEYEEAECCCREALRLRPSFAGALNNLGSALRDQGRLEEAEQAYLKTLELDPSVAEANVNLAILRQDSGALAGAVEYYRKKLRLDPESFEANVMLGIALRSQGRFEEAQPRFEKALELRSDDSVVCANLGQNLAFQGRIEEALDYYRRAMRGGRTDAHEAYLFHMHYWPRFTQEEIFAEHRRWARQYVEPLTAGPRYHANPPIPDRKLRIGYLSRDFCQHSVAYFIEPVIASHDRSRYEVYCYANVLNADAVTEKFRAAADVWRDIHLKTDEQVIRCIQEDGIDILVDLAGHTSGSRPVVLAAKPAPVQITYLGYPDTTGMTAVDYRITDATADPPGQAERFHTEELVRLPGCFLAYRPSPGAPESAPYRGNGFITFGSFNNIAKVNAEVVALWAAVLQAVPGSRLLLKSFAFSGDQARLRYRDEFARHGIDPGRLELLDFVPEVRSHLEVYHRVDIALDPFPYNGTTTTCEALWMGVPVITLAGTLHASRVGASLLSIAGLGELIAQDPEDYVAKAVELARDAARLDAYRTSLRSRLAESPLLDHGGFTRNLESAYRQLWHRWCGARTASSSAMAGQSVDGEWEIAIPGDVRVCMPASLHLMTPYILLEQEDWFEDEIGFVRSWFGRGMRAVDVGANFGVYALTLGKLAGTPGRVWAVEPSSRTLAYLKKSLGANGLANVTLVHRALSDRAGTARLLEDKNSELIRLAAKGDAPGGEKVRIETLDGCAAQYGWQGIDFLKIDAEGEEYRIVSASETFLERQSPLVMLELKDGAKINREALNEFIRRGYGLYRLLPGLNILVPFDQGGPLDPYWLNVFCCKEDRAAALAASGHLVQGFPSGLQWGDFSGAFSRYVDSMPWTDRFTVFKGRIQDDPYGLGLTCYATARDEGQPAPLRAEALRAGVEHLKIAAEQSASAARLISLARAAADFGYRELAVDTLGRLSVLIRGEASVEREIREPFLPPSRRLETVDPGQRAAEWLRVAVLEQKQRLGHYSSYFEGQRALTDLDGIQGSPFRSAEMERRRQLVRMRFGSQDAPSPADILLESLNKSFWFRSADETGLSVRRAANS